VGPEKALPKNLDIALMPVIQVNLVVTTTVAEDVVVAGSGQ